MFRTFVQARRAALLASAIFITAVAPASAATVTESGDAGQTRATAFDATVQDLAEIKGTIEPKPDPGDRDLYEVRVQKSCTLTMWTESDFDPVLALFAEDGTTIAWNGDRSDDSNESFVQQRLEPGTYFVGIASWSQAPIVAEIWTGANASTGSYPILFGGDCFDSDVDDDAVPNDTDNCRELANPNQLDFDLDGEGDACDDSDEDTVVDLVDNCVLVANTNQADNDADREGDVCDTDDDNDTLPDTDDNCPSTANLDQKDSDADRDGDACDSDDDNDKVLDVSDNCPVDANADQADFDGDGKGDACDDSDGDTVVDLVDNCTLVANTNQADNDADREGDACDADDDNDTFADADDNCPLIANANQRDSDGDGQGDACDSEFNSTSGKATGGGSVVSGGQNVAFSVAAKNESAGTIGTCQVVAGRSKIKCLDVDGYWQSATGDRVVLVGDALVNGTETRYRIELEDHGEPGNSDAFSIETDLGPSASGTLRGGNVQVHRP